jgi:hypothetical protein
MKRLYSTWWLAALLTLVIHAAPAQAQTPIDAPDIAVVSSGHGKVRLTVTAGPSGAPQGFTVWWMTAADFAAQGGVWPATYIPGEGWGNFIGTATLNTWGAASRSFLLGANESLDIEIGDLADESGVTGTTSGELVDGQDYVFCAYARGSTSSARSSLSLTLGKSTTPQGTNCTYTQGYWKTHPTAWPVPSLTLGTVNYSAAQLMSILGQPVGGNGLIALAHQLIATKLNGANGADLSTIAADVAAADALIGGLVVPPVGAGSLAPAATSTLTQALDDFNQGVTGPGHCGSTPVHSSTWGRLKSLYH